MVAPASSALMTGTSPCGFKPESRSWLFAGGGGETSEVGGGRQPGPCPAGAAMLGATAGLAVSAAAPPGITRICPGRIFSGHQYCWRPKDPGSSHDTSSRWHRSSRSASPRGSQRLPAFSPMRRGCSPHQPAGWPRPLPGQAPAGGQLQFLAYLHVITPQVVKPLQLGGGAADAVRDQSKRIAGLDRVDCASHRGLG